MQTDFMRNLLLCSSAQFRSPRLAGWLYMTIFGTSQSALSLPVRRFVANDSMCFTFGTTIHMNMLSQRAITNVTPILSMIPNILVTIFTHLKPRSQYALYTLFFSGICSSMLQFVPSSLTQPCKRNFLDSCTSK
jgi:hypothetical protein